MYRELCYRRDGDTLTGYNILFCDAILDMGWGEETESKVVFLI